MRGQSNIGFISPQGIGLTYPKTPTPGNGVLMLRSDSIYLDPLPKVSRSFHNCKTTFANGVHPLGLEPTVTPAIRSEKPSNSAKQLIEVLLRDGKRRTSPEVIAELDGSHSDQYIEWTLREMSKGGVIARSMRKHTPGSRSKSVPEYFMNGR